MREKRVLKKYILVLVSMLLIFVVSLSGCDNSSGGFFVEQEKPFSEQFVLDDKTLDEQNPTDDESVQVDDDVSKDEDECNTQEENKSLQETATYIRVKVSALNVREKPSTSSAVIGVLDYDDMVAYIKNCGAFYQTWYRGGIGYVSANSSYTQLYKMQKSTVCEVESVINEGLKLLGTPYVYGAVRLHDGKGGLLKGFNKTKFDCSSLMQYIFYYGASINLDLTTRLQVSQGDIVAKKNIVRGDLLFFTNASRYNKKGIERIGHVALYLGENYILHTASDFAVVEQISATRWSYFLESRRMI